MTPTPRPPGRGRLQLVLLALIFFGPLAGAFYLYYARPSFAPGLSAAHGTLVAPARPLPAAALTRPDGGQWPADLWTGRWSLVWIGPGACDAACGESLAATAVVRELLAQDAPRVQRVFLHTGPARTGLPGEGSDLKVASLDDPAASALAAEFAAAGGTEHIYIVDPHGNLMMRYARGDVRRDLLADMKRLLKYSHIG